MKQLRVANVGWIKWPKDMLDWQAVVNLVMKVRSFLKGVKFRDNRVLKRNIYPFRCAFALNLTAIRLSVTVSSGMIGLFSRVPLSLCVVVDSISRDKAVFRSTTLPLIRRVRYLITSNIAVWASKFFCYKRIEYSIKYLSLANKINFYKVTAIKNHVLLLENANNFSKKVLCS